MQTVDKSGLSHNPTIVPQSFWDESAKVVPQSHICIDVGNGTNRETGTAGNPPAPLHPCHHQAAQDIGACNPSPAMPEAVQGNVVPIPDGTGHPTPPGTNEKFPTSRSKTAAHPFFSRATKNLFRSHAQTISP